MGPSCDASVDGQAWDFSECTGTKHCPPRCPRYVDTEGTPLLIRPYQAEDWEALLAMYEDIDGHSRTLSLPPASREKTEQWLDHLTTNGWNLVAYDDRIVGHIAAVPADREEPQFVVFVHQDYHNRGIGTELVKQLIAHADDRDYEALTLDVATGNDSAISVYRNTGFEVVERLRGELSMRLSLDHPIADRAKRPPAERETNVD